MRLSDLLALDAVTEDGTNLGHVHDVRFRAATDNPLGWTLDSLIVGPTSFSVRLGYARGVVDGPWLLRVLFKWLTRHGRRIPWSAVVSLDEDHVVVAGTRRDFPHVLEEGEA